MKSWRAAMGMASAVVVCAVPAAAGGDRVLRAEVVLPAGVEEVWAAWATEEGVKTFFAPGARVEPRVDGAYDIYFDPKAEPGKRGAEGMRVLAYEPGRRLAFTWNAPPHIPTIRGQRTMVVVEVEPASAGTTRLLFTHLGWGRGADWDEAYAYFDRAWGGVVLPRLRQRFEKGPIDWSAPPAPAAAAPSLRTELRPD